MTGNEALKVIASFLVDNTEYMETEEVFELGRALGTIDHIIIQQTREVRLKSDNENN